MNSNSPGELRQSNSIFGTIVWLFTFLLWTAAFLNAAITDPASAQSGNHDSQRLTQTAFDRQIEKVLQNPEFDWRQPEESHSNDSSAVRHWIASIVNALSSLSRQLGREFHRLLSFLTRWRPTPRKPSDGAPFAIGLVTVLTYVFLAGIVGIATLFAIRLFKYRKPRQPVSPFARATPDLGRYEIAADEHPEDEWHKLAREKIASGDLRQGQRALFLAILSCLASHRFITIERWKSNCDYENELGRRAKHLPELPQLYAQSRVGFERCWYGERSLTAHELEAYGDLYERIKRAAA